MKKSVILLAVLILFAFTGVASAIVNYTHMYDPPDVTISPGNPVEWDVDLTIPAIGFHPASQDILSAVMTLVLSDDDGEDEKGWLTVEWGTEYFAINNPTSTVFMTIGSNASLGLIYLQDGKQHYKVTAQYGNFIFDKAILNVEATDPVPEPATMLLLGLGLIGIAVVYKRRNARLIAESV